MTAILELDRVTKRFGGLLAVNNLSFVVQPGEILGLIGPNGAGKSTLFNLINGLFVPNSGWSVFSGVDITGEKPFLIARHGLARTRQIVQPLTNIEAARAAAAVVGLDDQLQMLALHLSIAGKKRLELARALAAQPTLLLLDEVLAGPNPTEVEHMIGVIRRIRDSGVTILIIEHLMQAIMSLSDRIVVLNYGEKLAEGLPADVAGDPQVIEAYLGDPKLATELESNDGGAPHGNAANV